MCQMEHLSQSSTLNAVKKKKLQTQPRNKKWRKDGIRKEENE